MMDLLEQLTDLKHQATSGEMPIADIQRRLSTILLSHSEYPGVEKKAKKLDNDLELIIFTRLPENQLNAALGVIGEAIQYAKESSTQL
jgi:hypothetical protein